MGIFNFFNKDKTDSLSVNIPSQNIIDGNVVAVEPPNIHSNSNAMFGNNGNEQKDIPRSLFVEDKSPQNNEESSGEVGELKGVDKIYSFLQQDFDEVGYKDAIHMPDRSYEKEGLEKIKKTFLILIDREKHFYENRIYDFNFFIKSRKEMGYSDIANQLESEKDKIINDINKLKDLNLQVEKSSGLFEGVVLSYKKGFSRGIITLTQVKLNLNNL